jgi:hypothetical protein
MGLVDHKALQWASDALGRLSYYYEFENGNEAHVMRSYEEDRGRPLYDVFYKLNDESHKMLGVLKDDVLLLLDDLDEGGEACETCRI